MVKQDANYRGESMGSGDPLFGQCLLESLLRVSNEVFIASGVDKDTGTILPIALQFCEHIEVPTVRSKKYIAG